MILVTGPRYSGKTAYVQRMLQCDSSEMEQKVANHLLDIVGKTTDVDALVEELSTYAVVILPEVGSGVVPMQPEDVQLRERCGELAQMLALEADAVVRVLCGIPQFLKGCEEVWK